MSKDLKNYPCHNSSIIDDIKQILDLTTELGTSGRRISRLKKSKGR